MKTAIIFDLDGTLLYTLEDLYLSVNEMLKKFGFPLRTRDEVRSFVGNGVPKLVERSLPEGTGTEIYDAALDFFKTYYDAHCTDNTKAYSGMTDALLELKYHGYAMGVATNKEHSATEILCRRHFSGIVEAVLGQFRQFPPKPDPTCLYFVKGLLEADRAIYVGDSEVDIQTAKNANMPCVSVTWGYKDREFLEANGAQYIADNIRQMLDHIYEISRN